MLNLSLLRYTSNDGKILYSWPRGMDAVERVLSFLKNFFNDQQSRALEDYVELALMLV